MRIVYFDEVKPSPNAFPDYLLAGLSVSEESMRSALTSFHNVKSKHFSTLGLDESVEIHASFIYHGKGSYKGKDLSTRLQMLADFVEILQDQDVRLVYSWTSVPKLFNKSDALDVCFTHFCERAHNTIGTDSTGLMIGDLDSASRNHLWSKFSEFRKTGTPWAFGQDLPKFADTVHFVDSRVCELVQLADVYAFQLTAESRCLIPRFDGVILSTEWKEALWDKFVMGAPRPRTPSELQYSDRKLRSRS